MQGRSAHHNHHDCTDTGCTKMDSQLWAPDGHVLESIKLAPLIHQNNRMLHLSPRLGPCLDAKFKISKLSHRMRILHV